MTHPSPEPERPTAPAGSHPRHDEALIAAYVSGGLDERTRVAAVERIAGCAECAGLAADLRSIAVATRALPPRRLPAGRTFTLDATEAARLSRRGRLLAFLRPFGRGGFIPAKPIGVALSTLGLVGILVSAGVGSFPGFQAAGAPERNGMYDTIGTPRGAYDPTTQGTGKSDASPEPPGQPGAEGLGPDGAGGVLPPTEAPDDVDARDLSTEDERDRGPILPVSVIVVAGGLALLVLRRAAVRLT